MSYFPPYGDNKNKIEVKLDFSKHATISYLKKHSGYIAICQKKMI